MADLTEADVLELQAKWGGAIKTISKTYLEKGDYVGAAASAAAELLARRRVAEAAAAEACGSVPGRCGDRSDSHDSFACRRLKQFNPQRGDRAGPSSRLRPP